MSKTIIKIFAIWFVIIFTCNGQPSPHLYDKVKNQEVKKIDVVYNSITSFSAKPAKNIFGFLPYWELYNQDLTIRFDLLTHIAVFDFLLENDGSISYPPDWENQSTQWSNIFSEAKSNDVKVIMTISNLSLTDTDSLLVSNLINNQSIKSNFFSDVKNIISLNNFDGVNLDFENIKLGERGDPINNFTKEFKDSLNSWFTGQELSFATPAVNWGSRWKLKELSEICDYLFIMAYDYHGSWSTSAGPVSPLTGGFYNYHTIIESDYSEVDPDKIILGVPYYGAQWQTDNDNPYTEVIPYGEPNTHWIGSVDFKEIGWFGVNHLINFDVESGTTYFLTTRDRQIYDLTWIDSDSSLGLKYDFALEKDLRGIGLWSLGKDGSNTRLWNLIEEKFADSTTSVEEEKLANDFILYQNYPNPFNPTTTIKFGLPEAGLVNLTVYNILGEEVVKLISKEMQTGYHQVVFETDNLAGGMYIYRISVGDKFTAIKKMLLIK